MMRMVELSPAAPMGTPAPTHRPAVGLVRDFRVGVVVDLGVPPVGGHVADRVSDADDGDG